MNVTDQLTYTGRLVVVQCWCGLRHAIPEDLDREQHRQHNAGHNLSLYCPLGHSYVPSGESEVAVLERRLAEQHRANGRLVDEVARERRRAAAARGVATRVRRRAEKALCPVPECRRSFANVARHLATQHPGYDAASCDAGA